MSVIVVTTLLITLVMLIVWDLHPAWAALWLLVYLPLECAFLSATLVKVVSGGWVALVVAAVVSSINIIWWWGCRVKAMGLRDKQVGTWQAKGWHGCRGVLQPHPCL
jgi:K+ transporter